MLNNSANAFGLQAPRWSLMMLHFMKLQHVLKKTVLLVLEPDVKLYKTIVSEGISLKNLVFNYFGPTFCSKPLDI